MCVDIFKHSRNNFWIKIRYLRSSSRGGKMHSPTKLSATIPDSRTLTGKRCYGLFVAHIWTLWGLNTTSREEVASSREITELQNCGLEDFWWRNHYANGTHQVWSSGYSNWNIWRLKVCKALQNAMNSWSRWSGSSAKYPDTSSGISVHSMQQSFVQLGCSCYSPPPGIMHICCEEPTFKSLWYTQANICWFGSRLVGYISRYNRTAARVFSLARQQTKWIPVNPAFVKRSLLIALSRRLQWECHTWRPWVLRLQRHLSTSTHALIYNYGS